MRSIIRPSFQLLTWCFFVSIIGHTSIGFADDKSDREKQLADLEKQLTELKKKYDAIKASPVAQTSKKTLTYSDHEIWKTIRGSVLSNDGKWFAARIANAKGEGEVIVRSVTDGKETRFVGSGGGSLDFSQDSKWLAFSITPPAPKGPTSSPRPKPKVIVVNLSTGVKTEFEGMQSFQFSGEASSHIAFRKATDTPVAGGGPSQGPSPTPRAEQSGSDLVLHDLTTKTELLFGNVSEFNFDKKGTALYMVVDASGQIGNGVLVRDMKTGVVASLESGKATYRNLAFNREQTALALYKETELKPGSKSVSIIGISGLGGKQIVTVYDPHEDKSFPSNYLISTSRPIVWTDDLGTWLFSIAEHKTKEPVPAPKEINKKEVPIKGTSTEELQPPSKKDSPVTTSAKPDMVIWHWKDERLQPMQERQAALDKSRTYLSAYHLKDKKFVQLGDENCWQVVAGPQSKFAIGLDSKPYQLMSTLDGKRFTDIYAIEIATGKKTKVLSKNRYPMSANSAGTHFLHYEDGHFYVLDLATGKSINITEKIAVTAFIDTDDDHNVIKPPTRSLGWSRDGKAVILSDGYDLWKVTIDGTGGENLTLNGKKDAIRYQSLIQFEAEPLPGIDLNQPLYISIYGEWTKKAGYAKWTPGKPGATSLIWADASVTGLSKAKFADVYSYQKGTAVEYPDVYVSGPTLTDGKKVTTVNPQQADYAWCSGTKLIEYKGTEGKRLQGALYLPANYEPGKKYPTVVYIYEKLSQGLHQYSPPGSWGFNRSVYTSNGYAVFTPDITYRLNDPGISAVECVLPALDAAIATGVVDPDKIGLQGHSWGGYQTAFLVTQTNRFKAAVAGAPLTDLVSMYSSIYWNSGSANQPIFESSQGRFTGGYWSQQEAYIRNSPVYQATKVNTPLVILHNDKDGAVDFVQGIEYYNTLRRLQKPVVMLQYKGENHGLVKPENMKDYSQRMREFFDHHLMGKTAPDWWVDGIPHLKLEEHLKNRK